MLSQFRVNRFSEISVQFVYVLHRHVTNNDTAFDLKSDVDADKMSSSGPYTCKISQDRCSFQKLAKNCHKNNIING